MALVPSVAAGLRAAKPVVPLPAARRAAVAVVLRSLPDSTAEILYILRQASPSDPWSGQVGFPGGRRQASDADDYAAAVRECREERSTHARMPYRELDGRALLQLPPLLLTHPRRWAWSWRTARPSSS